MTSYKVHPDSVNGVNGIAIPQSQTKANLIETVERNAKMQ